MVSGCAAEVLKHRRTEEQNRRQAVALGLDPRCVRPPKNQSFPFYTPARDKDVFNHHHHCKDGVQAGGAADDPEGSSSSVKVIRRYHRRNDIQLTIAPVKISICLRETSDNHVVPDISERALRGGSGGSSFSSYVSKASRPSSLKDVKRKRKGRLGSLSTETEEDSATSNRVSTVSDVSSVSCSPHLTSSLAASAVVRTNHQRTSGYSKSLAGPGKSHIVRNPTRTSISFAPAVASPVRTAATAGSGPGPPPRSHLVRKSTEVSLTRRRTPRSSQLLGRHGPTKETSDMEALAHCKENIGPELNSVHSERCATKMDKLVCRSFHMNATTNNGASSEDMADAATHCSTNDDASPQPGRAQLCKQAVNRASPCWSEVDFSKRTSSILKHANAAASTPRTGRTTLGDEQEEERLTEHNQVTKCCGNTTTPLLISDSKSKSSSTSTTFSGEVGKAVTGFLRALRDFAQRRSLLNIGSSRENQPELDDESLGDDFETILTSDISLFGDCRRKCASVEELEEVNIHLML